MIETRWYDAFLLIVEYGQGRLELRLGAVCLLEIVLVVWKLVRAIFGPDQGVEPPAVYHPGPDQSGETEPSELR